MTHGIGSIYFSLVSREWARIYSSYQFQTLNTNLSLFFISPNRLTNICINPENGIRYFPHLSELRVLKICSISLSLRRTVNVYWQSLMKMRDLLLYIVYAMIVVSVVCLQIYMGVLSQRCVKIPPNGLRGDNSWSNITNDPGELRIAITIFLLVFVKFRFYLSLDIFFSYYIDFFFCNCGCECFCLVQC